MVGLHIVVEHLAVSLFLALNVVEQLADVLVLKLKHTGVVERGGVLLGRQRVGAEILVVLLVGRGGRAVGLREGGQRLYPGAKQL